MILVIGTARVTPGSRDQLVAAMQTMAAASAPDDGCLEYRFAADVRDPDVLVGVEVWRDQAALDAHMSHEHTTEFLASVSDLFAVAPVMQLFTADQATR
jgi:quinol monooxygenase YgiN